MAENPATTPIAIGSKAWFVAGMLLLLFLHFYRLAHIPGLHYDEAWAMNYSWRIASESGFWPLQAMSPYTAPWAHYWAALWLKIFGPSLWMFRASQVLLSLAGLAAVCMALPRPVRLIFPWAMLLLPGLLLNHRFAIELTGFHVLAFGSLCWCISRRWYYLAALAAIAGTTAHILFYAVLLGLLFAVLHTTPSGVAIERRAKKAFVAYFALMALFFLQVLIAIPEKGKAGALVLSSVGAVALVLAGCERWHGWRSVWWGRALPVLAAVFVFNALFFLQGTWSAAIATGKPYWQGSIFYLGSHILLLMVFFGHSFVALKNENTWLRVWFLSGTFFMGIMMLKPAPRYFEIALIGIATIWANDWWRYWKTTSWKNHFLRQRLSLRLSLTYCVLANLVFVFVHLVEYSPLDTSLRYLFFKDSSRDFLDKQSLVRFLGGSGCEFSDIETHDPRLLETLKALSLGDWRVDDKKHCNYLHVSRRTEEGATGEPFGEFLLRRKQ